MPASGSVHEAIASFLLHRELKNLSPNTLQLYRRRLAFWETWRAQRTYGPRLAEVTLDELRQFIRYVMLEHVPHATNPRRPPTTTRMKISSVQSDWRILRTLWNYLRDEGLLTPEQERFFQRGRIPCPTLHEAPRVPCPPEIKQALLSACTSDDPEEEWRNRAIILLLAQSGMRVAELCGDRGLCDQDVSLANRWAAARGKGSVVRYVFWGEEAQGALEQYLRHRRGTWGGAQPLIRGMSQKNDGAAFSPDAVRSLFRRLAERAEVELVAGAPVHSLRHAFAHDGLDAGIDGLLLQQLLGHASIETTQRYVRECPDRLQRVYDRFYSDPDER